VHSNLAIEGIRQQALLTIEQCNTCFITGRFYAQNPHWSVIIRRIENQGRIIMEV
jgi:hypothetical protein